MSSSVQYILESQRKRKRILLCLPDVCMVVMVVVVVTVVDIVVVSFSEEAGVSLWSWWPGLVLFFSAVSLASPFSIFPEVASSGKAPKLWGWLPSEDEGGTPLFSPPEPLLFGVTWVVSECVVGSTLSVPLVLSFDFFWGIDTGSAGVVGENVVSGDVAATVAVEATSEKAGASSWGTSWVTRSAAFGADTEPGMVGYAAT